MKNQSKQEEKMEMEECSSEQVPPGQIVKDEQGTAEETCTCLSTFPHKEIGIGAH